MKNLIIGAGEVGTGLHQIFSKAHQTFIRDVELRDDNPSGVEILHIAYPDGPQFVFNTEHYIRCYTPKLTIIHSSVRPGTTERIANAGVKVVHSPVRGRQPHLAQEMLIYPKYIGSRSKEDLDLAAEFLKACGWPVVRVDNPTSTELLKLVSNVHMGLEIAWRQEVGRMLKAFKIDREDYESWEKTYFTGYILADQTHLIRPQMRPDPIGGHCILECTALLKSMFPSEALEFIGRSNEQTKNEKEITRDRSAGETQPAETATASA